MFKQTDLGSGICWVKNGISLNGEYIRVSLFC